MNNDICELNINELGAVSGGVTIGPITIEGFKGGFIVAIKGVGAMSIHNDGTVCVSSPNGGVCTGGPNPDV
jgi:hypothetical protein